MEHKPMLTRFPSQQLKYILQQVHHNLSPLVSRIAPYGWQSTCYHHQMQQDRKEIHQDFIKDLSIGPRFLSTPMICDKNDYDPFTLENYFAITFPAMDNDRMEAFYIIAHHLLDITQGSTLVHMDTGKAYYITEEQLKRQMLQVAYEHQDIDELVLDIHSCLVTAPCLQEMDAIAIYECLFAILRKMRYQLLYLDTDLLYITELQEMYEEIQYAPIPVEERERDMKQIKQHIQLVIHCNTRQSYRLEVDPLDLHTIVALMNSHKTDPIILAYLHVYDSFPEGYPYKASDYTADDELLD